MTTLLKIFTFLTLLISLGLFLIWGSDFSVQKKSKSEAGLYTKFKYGSCEFNYYTDCVSKRVVSFFNDNNCVFGSYQNRIQCVGIQNFEKYYEECSNTCCQQAILACLLNRPKSQGDTL